MSDPRLEIVVRNATRDDLNTLVKYNAAMAKETEGKTLDLELLSKGVSAVLDRDNLGFYLMAEVDCRPVGQLMITTEWSDWRNGFVWWLQSVYVEPEFRRRGVFRRLYETLRDEALDEGGVVGLRLYVEEHNRIAQETYRGLGMESGGYVVMEEMLTGVSDRSDA